MDVTSVDCPTFDKETNIYSPFDTFSQQSQSSVDSGVSGIMDQSISPSSEMSSNSYVVTNLPSDFNGVSNTDYNVLHQTSVSIAYPQYRSPNQLVPNNQFNFGCGSSTMNVNASVHVAEPYLEVVEEPTDKPFRFRYKSEMHGTHGSLMGKHTKKNKRTYPTVALRNFNFPMKAYIYCSLYQVSCEGRFQRSPHSHKLVIRRGDREESDPHEIEVSNSNNFTAIFQGMGIIHTAKKNIKEELYRKLRQERDFEGKRILTENEISAIQRDADKQSKEMNLNQVCLCFQAFLKNETDNTMDRICEPVYSSVINNMKSALTGELRITRMSKYVSSVQGGEEIFMFVEKVCKNNIKVKFFEFYEDEGGNNYWEGFGVFMESDVHHQYGIVLRTPPYRKTNIESPVHVKVQLYRPSDGATSEPIEFRYKSAVHVGAKRSRSDSRDLIPTVLDLHNSSTTRTIRDDGPNQSCSINNSFGGQSSNNNQQNFSYEDSLFAHDTTLLGYFGTITASELDFSYHDLKDLPSSPEELCSLLDIEVGEPMLQIDSVCVEKSLPHEKQELGCPLIDKLRALIRLFKNNFDDNKLRDMINVLVEQQTETGENILLDLIKHGSVEEIRELIIILIKYKLKAVLNSLNDLDQNCFHILMIGGHYKLLKIFLSLGVNVNQVDAFGDNALHLAVARDDDKSVKELLKEAEDLDLNGINDNGFSPLLLAVAQNNLVITKLLVEGGADLYKKVPQSGRNALHIAISNADISMPLIAYLIECDEKLLHEENNSGMNVLQAAYSQQPENLIKYLSQYYAESYSTGDVADDDDDSTSDSGDEEFFSKLFDAPCFKMLFKILSSADKWKNVLIITEEEQYIDKWQDHPTPAKMVLLHLESKGKSIDEIQEIFDLLDDKEAIDTINEMLARKLHF